MLRIDKAEFEKATGLSLDSLPKTEHMLNQQDLRLTAILGEDRDALLLAILKRILSDTQVIGAPYRTMEWEKGWIENKEKYTNSRNLIDLLPRFVRNNQPIRWRGNFFAPSSPNFEQSYIQIIRGYIFERFLINIDALYEFGAGTGHNLVHASEMLGTLQLIGTDFVPSAVELMKTVAQETGIDLHSELFDMLNPNYDLKVVSNSAALTFGSIEQLAGNYEEFVSFLINKQFKICIHIEPTLEFYREDSLVDFLAIQFQQKRGYSSGLGSFLSSHSRVDLVHSGRLGFGSLLMEGYNLFVWRPLVEKDEK